MKVQELIALLENCDPEAEVTFASQPNYPFEYSITGVVLREDVVREDAQADPDYGDDDEPLVFDAEAYDYGEHNLGWASQPKQGTDVILVEGRQLSYASRNIWNAPTVGAW